MASSSTTTYRHTRFPQQLVVEITAACNQACIFCGRTYMDRPKKTMSDDLFRRIVDEVAAESPYTELWPTFMGEAMLLGDRLFQSIAYARDAGCKKITLNTNGTRIDETTIPGILECGIDRFIISCDAHTPETHRIVRPANNESASRSLDEIYAGLHALIDANRARGDRAIVLEFQFSIFDENQHEVGAFRDYWLEHGAIVKVRPKIHWSGSVSGGEVGAQDRQTCLWALESAAIHWNGNVVMCPVDCDGKYVAGNITQQSFSEIWNGALRWLRELQIQARFSELPEICRSCPDWRQKKARAYYPDAASQAAYEQFVNLGRDFMERHFWDAPSAPGESPTA